MELQVADLPEAGMALSNRVYCHPSDLARLGSGVTRVELGGTVYDIAGSEKVSAGTVGLSSLVRTFLQVEKQSLVVVKPFRVPPDATLYLDTLTLSASPLRPQPQPVELECKSVSENLKQTFGDQILIKGMQVALRVNSTIVKFTISDLSHIPATNNQEEKSGKSSDPILMSLKAGAGGILSTRTNITFVKAPNATIKIIGQAQERSAKNMINTNFEKLGIGGLNKEFGDIFRRAFVSRILPPDVVKKLGIKHVRGLMLYGPPGCGKTLIARQISKVLQGGETARMPKTVSGPEILSKYVGDSEKNVRELFAEAEQEQLEAGDESELHVIIFDEIDAICRQRGSKRDGTGVGDSVVNQLLAKIDGVNSLNNVLLIGMTNRLDMIDSALLRPGRFEVQIEIGLPDEQGRLQILNIHTKSMREASCLAEDIDLDVLAKETKNFSGAEIEGLVKAAVSFATQRHVNAEDLSKLMDTDKIVVTSSDFFNALDEVHPAFGVQQESELKGLFRNGIVKYSDAFEHLQRTLNALSLQSQTSERTPLLSLLLHGPKGSGKTALVAKLAAEAGFPFTKLVSAESMLGMSDNQKCSQLATIFEDAYKSPCSLIILDDLEHLIEYVPIGPRFCNPVLQALVVLINRPPPREDRKLMVIGTSSLADQLEDLGLVQVFNVALPVPVLQTDAEIEKVIQHLTMEQVDPLEVELSELKLISENCKKPITVKKLLLVVEMARQGGSSLSYARFMECLSSIGL